MSNSDEHCRAAQAVHTLVLGPVEFISYGAICSARAIGCRVCASIVEG